MLHKQSVVKYLPIPQAAKFCGVCLNTFYNAIYDKDIVPDKILTGKLSGKRHKTTKYLVFSTKTLTEWKRQRELFIPTSKAAKFLGLSHKQLLLRVYSGKLIPDRIIEVSKGKRGMYYTFFFLRETLIKFKQN